MPRAFTDKDERQYEDIKKSSQDRGVSDDRAEEIAARTVNKERREEGRTESGQKTTEGTGNPNSPLQQRSRDELYNRAQELHIHGRSKMDKGELVKAIQKQEE